MAWKTPSLWRDDRAAIAPLYAIALPMLVVMAGVGFDYGRIMALDSELQAAADHAAIAAATQLDGGSDAIDRAEAAARNYFATATSAYVNETRFATVDDDADGDTRPITRLTIRFFEGYADDTLGNVTTVSEDAAIVEVTVDARRVGYALTPIVDAVANSGWDDAIGRALAGVESATCNVPPLMFCQPEVDGVAVSGFPTAADIGKGLLLHMRANEADPWAPGNFGFLDIPYDLKGNPNTTLGLNSNGLGCAGDDVESRTGVREPEAGALNTRVDLPDSYNCDTATGDYCSALNTRKNWVRKEQPAGTHTAAEAAAIQCNPADNSNTWVEDTWNAQAGYGRDTSFNGPLGNGNWNGSTYMSVNHPGQSLPGNGSRWAVYNWELADASRRVTRRVHQELQLQGNSGKYTVTNYCSYPNPVTQPPGYGPSGEKDRRVLTVAAVDCTSLNGHDVVKINKWVDLFLVQPANEGSADKEFMTEIKGPADLGGGGSGFQFFSKRKVVLIR